MLKIIIANGIIGGATINSVGPDRDACNLRIKTVDSYVKDGQRQEIEDWHDVVFFGKKGRFDNMLEKVLAKGNRINVDSDRMIHKRQEKDGNVYTNTQIIGNLSSLEVVYFNVKDEGAAPAQNGQNSAQAAQAAQAAHTANQSGGAPAPAAGFDDFDDDIPF